MTEELNTQIIYNRFSGFVAYEEEEDSYGKKNIGGVQYKSYERGVGGVQ